MHKDYEDAWGNPKVQNNCIFFNEGQFFKIYKDSSTFFLLYIFYMVVINVSFLQLVYDFIEGRIWSQEME